MTSHERPACPARTGLPAPGWIRRALEAEHGQRAQREQDTRAERTHGTILVPSTSRPGTVHAVTFDGCRRTCSCPSFDHRGRCTHITRLNVALRALTTPTDRTQT